MTVGKCLTPVNPSGNSSRNYEHPCVLACTSPRDSGNQDRLCFLLGPGGGGQVTQTGVEGPSEVLSLLSALPYPLMCPLCPVDPSSILPPPLL